VHDAGWEALDAALPLDAQGLPVHVFETPLMRALPAWSASTEAAIALHPYAGLLVSLHGLGLSARALMPREKRNDPQAAPTPPHHSPHELFAVNRFQHAQIEIQENLRRQLQMRVDLPLKYGLASPGRSADEDLLLCNFRLLQWLDRLSLDLCFDRVCVSAVDQVYPRPGVEPIALQLSRDEDGCFGVNPWPFDQSEVTLTIPARRMPNQRFASAEEFCDQLHNAQAVVLNVSLHT
jgi:hypothetical protein